MGVSKVKQLMAENQLSEALHLVERLGPKDQPEGLLLKCELLDQQGKYIEVEEVLQQIKNDFKDQMDSLLDIRLRIIEVSINLRTIGLKSGLKFSLETYKLIKKLTKKQRKFIADEEGRLNLLIGVYYDYLGDWDRALKYYTKSLKIRQAIGSKQEIAGALNNIGEIYRNKGELQLALDYYNQGHELYNELKNNNKIAITLHNIGIVRIQQGYADIALGQLKQSLRLFQEDGGNTIDCAETLLYLIQTGLYLNRDDLINTYFMELKEINRKEENKFINLYTKIAKGLILKDKNRFIEQAEAQQIFRQIISEEIISQDITIFALLNLCELLLHELRVTGDEEILQEINEFSSRLDQIAKDNESSSLQVESYIIKSRLALLELDIDLARDLLNQAQLIAELKGLNRLAVLISQDHDTLFNSIDRWQQLIDSNASLSDRLELAEFEDMIVKLIRKNVDVSVLPDENPVLFLILDSGGNTRFAYKFDKHTDLKEGLIGVFLTAITNFSKDAFSSSSPIERIKHQDYTIIIRNIRDYLFTYIFKGQSYVAMKKMESLTNEVESEKQVWNLFEEYKLKLIPENNRLFTQILKKHITVNRTS